MRLKKLGYVCLLIATILAGAALAKTVTIAVKEAQGRSGPGSYYELKVLIPEGKKLEVLESKGSWFKVKYNDQDVWVSENSIAGDKETSTKQQQPGEMPTSLAFENVTEKATPATLAAAIKGFWTRYSRADKRNLAALPVDGYTVQVDYVESFSDSHSRLVSREQLWKEYKLVKKYKKSSMTYEKEHSIGYTIASSVAEGSLFEDSKVIDYVHAVGWYLGDGTERYDIKYTFYILDTDRINAVSCPGGYIVLTRGLLKLLGEESELAALLAHEMAHIIAGHAIHEMEDSKVSIKADSAFDMLNSETSGPTETEDELIAITNRAVAIATSPKLDEQEFEADRMALRYLARSGYDLKALPRMLHTMMERHEQNIDIFDLNYRNHPDFKKRIQLIEKELKSYSSYSGRTFSEDFGAVMVF